MDTKQYHRYALACPTSMGVRIPPPERMAVQNSNLFYMQATSAETNVLNVASSLRARVRLTYEIRQGQPCCGFHQAPAPRTEHPL
ncbi:MAG: hypothetical protein ACLS3C_03930 [Oscillospiraceae bacterium]